MNKKTIANIENVLSGLENEDDPRFKELLSDERKGVQKLIHRWRKNKEQLNKLEDMHQMMMEFEQQAYAEGFSQVGGIDEAGRGPLAGPVVAACVVLPSGFKLLGLTDSKQLPKEKREVYFNYIMKHAAAVGTGKASAQEIDSINIYEATKLAMQRAVESIHSSTPDYLLIDAMTLSVKLPQKNIIKGDAKSLSIAAASIIAKVTRDRYMEELGEKYPEYGFARHAGYGTEVHLNAIGRHGILPEHRKSFAPVKKFI